MVNAEEHNDSLREVDALKKSLGQSEQKAEAAAGARERLELELTKAAEAKERLQQEAAGREEQLATVAEKLMAAAKAISVSDFACMFGFSCLVSLPFFDSYCTFQFL